MLPTPTTTWPFMRCCLIATLSAAARAPQVVRREIGGKRLRAELPEQRVLRRFAREHPAAEPARIVEAQQAAAREAHVDVVVQAVGGRLAQVAQAARHAEMHEQRAGLRAEQEILAAPLERVDSLAGQLRRERLRNRPAQPRLAHLDRGDRAADDVGGQAAPRRLYLGKLGHTAIL